MITNDVTNRCNPLYEAAWAGLPIISIYDESTKDLLKHRDNALLSGFAYNTQSIDEKIINEVIEEWNFNR